MLVARPVPRNCDSGNFDSGNCDVSRDDTRDVKSVRPSARHSFAQFNHQNAARPQENGQA